MTAASASLWAAGSRVAVSPAAAPRASSRGADFRIDSNLVLIPVTVTNARNGHVPGLEREDFRVFEDGAEQEVRYFSAEQAPLSVGIVFDISGSMRHKLPASHEAVERFLRTMNPADEAFLVAFSDRPVLTLDFSRRPEDLQTRLLGLHAAGRTALIDSIYLALDRLRGGGHPRRALLVISDGEDNNSRYDGGSLINLVRESDAQIHVIGIAARDWWGGKRRARPSFTERLLRDVARESGGRYFPVAGAGELPAIAAKIGRELREHYILGYSPSSQPKDGKYRPVRVELSASAGKGRLRVHARRGYYAPAE